MQHSFSMVPAADIQRSRFDRSSNYKTCFNASELIPFFADEALPGDTWNLRTSGFCRLSTPIYPVMDDLLMDTFYFAIPMRLLQKNFVKMMGEQEAPGDSIDFVSPKMTSPAGGYQENSISDYLGIPTKIENLTHNSYFHRAIALCWNEWFRDQNLQDPVAFSDDDGPDDPADYNTILKRGKRPDYFNSGLPWPQKGQPVEIPLGTTAPVEVTVNGIDSAVTTNSASNQVLQYTQATPQQPTQSPVDFTADLSSATASTVNALRAAFQIQKMLERDARGGTRFPEILMSHFSVRDPMYAVLQRPQFLGGGTTPVNIHQVAATTELKDVDPGANDVVGALGAFGTASFSGHGFTRSFTEHSIIIGFVNVRLRTYTYQQGLNRMFSRNSRYDWYWPSLSHLGEQETLNKEIYADGTPVDDEVFNYQERYAEYRYKPSVITSSFRSNAATPLDAWHLGLDFASRPLFNDAFIEDNIPVDRVVQVPSEPDFIGDFYHKLVCARPMPLYGTPGLIDHF